MILFCQGSCRDMTPQQDSLSGVIICPAYREGQRLRVNSFTTNNSSITRRASTLCQLSQLNTGALYNPAQRFMP
jgi:hypothetical protein